MDINAVNRLNNEFRSLTSGAKFTRLENNNVATREEGLCYQKAAEIAGQLASLMGGKAEERAHWSNKQQECEDQMRRIWRELHPEPARATGSKVDPTEETANDDGETKAPKSSKKNDDSVSAEIVSRWYQEDPGYGFDNVAGMEEIIEKLKSCVKSASVADLNDYLGMETVQSFFFYGPPGCGKTYIIEAFAHELMQQGYNYMKLESADIHSKFSGEADKIVKRAFAEAVEHAPCILFMDEVDGICQNRSMPNLSDFNMTLTTTFLTSYNSLSKANKENKSVIFIGATNYPANVDMAMLDRVEMVQIPLPDEKVRKESVIRKFSGKIQPEDENLWDWYADKIEGYNQRDINRINDILKKKIRNNAMLTYGDAVAAVDALKSGEMKLTKELIMEAYSEYHPSPKDDVEKALDDFEQSLRMV